MRILLEHPSGELKLQEPSFVHVGMELKQDHAPSATLTQSGFTTNLQPISTTPKLWAARQKLLSPEDAHMCQRKLGDLCWLATVSRPDIRARLARATSRINSLQGSDVYRINDLIKTAKPWQTATALKYVSSSLQGGTSSNPKGEKPRQRQGGIHNCTTYLAGWPDAAFGDQSSLGKCRLGYVIGLTASTLSGPCHIIH